MSPHWLRQALASLTLLLVTAQALAQADLAVTVSDNPDPVAVNANVDYTVNVSNAAASPSADGVNANIFYASALTPVPQPTPGWTCTGVNPINCALSGGSLAGGSSATPLVLRFQAPAAPQTVQISVTSLFTGSDINPANNTNITQSTQVIVAQANLNAAIVASTPTANVGTPLSFTTQISNLGPGNAPNTVVNGILSGPIQFSGFSTSPAWNCTFNANGGVVQCTYIAGSPTGTLANGVTASNIVINGVAGPGTGNAQLTMTPSSSAPDPSPGGATASIAVSNPPPPAVDLSLIQSVVGIQPIGRGQPFTFRLQVSNSTASNQQASGVSINDPLPAGISLQSFSGSNWSCTGSVVCSFGGTLAIGQAAPPLDLVVVYNLPVPTNGSSVTNVATVTGAEADPNVNNNTASAIANLRGTADVSVALTGPASVIAGSPFTTTLTASNSGPDDAANVSTSVTFSPVFTVDTVSGGAGWSCIAAGQNVSCTRSTFAVGSSVAATIGLLASSAGTGNSTATIDTSSFDPNTANNASALSTVVAAQNSSLALSMTDSADPVATGDEFDYVITVTNTGNIPQNNFTLVDTLPTQVSFRSFTGTGWTCTGTAIVNCSLPATLAPNASSNLRLRVRAESAGTASNQAQVSSAQSATSTSASESTLITANLALQFTNIATPSSVPVGGDISFALTVRNASPTADANGLVLINTLPPGVQFRNVDAPDWVCASQGQLVDCRRNTLARNAESLLTIVATVTSPGSLVNRAQLNANNLPTALVANAPFTVVPAPSGVDLVLELSDTPDPVTVGEVFELTSRIVNFGPQSATGLTLTIPLAAGVEGVGFSGAGWSCTFGTQAVCTLSSLAVDGQASVSVRVRSAQAGTVTHSASVTSQQIEATPSNNTDTETTTVQNIVVPPQSADLQLSASAPASAAAGTTVEISASLRNRGPGAASMVVLRTTPGGPLTLSAGSGTGFTCGAEGSALVCRGAGLPANQTAELRLTGQINANGTGSATATLALSSATPDPVPADNSASVSITVTPPQPQTADLSIVKTDSVDPVLFAAPFSYTLTVRNLGPTAAAGVVIRDTLPSGVILVSATGPGLTCTGTTAIECRANAPLPASQILTATLQVTAPTTAGTVTNEATVSATTADPQPSNNRATQETTVRAPADDDAEEEIEENVNPLDPIANEAARPVVQLCSGASGQVAAFCNALLGQAATGNDVTDAVRAVYPEEVLSQFTSLNQLSTTQFFNVDARMAELRGGGGGFSLSGLTVINGSQAIPLSLFSGLIDDEPEIGGAGDLISPWGFFANGTVSRGDQSIRPGEREVVQDFDSVGVTAGVDYRYSARFVLGAAIGYNQFSSGLTDSGALDTDGFTLTGYGSYYVSDKVYVDSRVSYGRVSLDQTRRIRATLGNFSVDDTASGQTDATQLSFATSIGYHINRAGWTITPNAFLRYVQSDVDAFSEQGSAFAARFSSQDVDSLVYGVGLQVNRAFSLDNGVLLPSFDLTWNQEAKADDTEIGAAFINGDAGEAFVLRPDTPDRSYGSVGFGLVYILANGRQAYLQFRESIGQEGLDRSTLNFGARFEF